MHPLLQAINWSAVRLAEMMALSTFTAAKSFTAAAICATPIRILKMKKKSIHSWFTMLIELGQGGRLWASS
jgi:hypothetical protein